MRAVSVTRPLAIRRQTRIGQQRQREFQILELGRLVDRQALHVDTDARTQQRMPDANRVISLGQIGQLGNAVATGMRDMWRVGHVQVRDHMVVDVAADSNDAELVELQRRGALARCEHELELPGRRKRIGVMPRVVAVVEDHFVAGPEDLDVRNERFVLLVDCARGR